MHNFTLLGLFVTKVGHGLKVECEADGCCKVVVDFDMFVIGFLLYMDLDCLGCACITKALLESIFDSGN